MPGIALVLLCEPEFAEADRLWIESLRSRYDPNCGKVGPHFTVVFPVSCQDVAAIRAHAESIARHTGQIAFHLRSALVVKDFQNPTTHVFLVPDEGFAAIVRLHDECYTGPLAHALRLDIPFIPHITVGSFPQPEAAKEVADHLNSTGISIAGTLSALDVIQYSEESLTRLARLQFVGDSC